MNLHDLLESLGISPPIALAGALGGLLRALSRRTLKVREVVLSPPCGLLGAMYLTKPVVHLVRYYGWPPVASDDSATFAAAFVVGTCSMWLSDWIFEFIVR